MAAERTMSTIAEIRIAADEFALAETLGAVPETVFEAVRIVAHGTEHVLPLLWAETSSEFDHLEERIRHDSSVENVRCVAKRASEQLYHVEWTSRAKSLVNAINRRDGIVLGATGASEAWNLRVLFPDRNALSAMYTIATDNGHQLDVQRISDLTDGRGRWYGLTDNQYHALVTAYERGYYDIPQEVTLEELADEFEVTSQAVSQRLHRGYKNLIENTLVINPVPNRESG